VPAALRSRALPRALALAAAGLVCLAVTRALVGVPLGSDAYSYISWAGRAVDHGTLSHTRFDYTVPKPLELGVATVGQLLGAPLAVFQWWTLLGLLGCGLAAGALANRLAGRRAAELAVLLAVLLPVVIRGSFRGDSNVPYAALAVGAAACGAGTLGASGLLAAAGLLRPEAWGLALLSAVLGWREGDGRERAAAVAAIVLPPALWVALDRVSTGRATYSLHVLDAYIARFHPVEIGLSGLPGATASRVVDVCGWVVLVLALAALVRGLRRRPLDAAVVFPVALAVAVAIEVARGQVSESDLSRMLTALALFAAVGAAVTLAQAPTGWLAALGAAVCLVASAWWIWGAVHDVVGQGATADELATRVAPVAARAAGGRLVATDRDWQAALSLYAHLPRTQVVPRETIGRETPHGRVGVLAIEQRGAQRPAWLDGPPALQLPRWTLYAAR
jgi:hypothetical protein